VKGRLDDDFIANFSVAYPDEPVGNPVQIRACPPQ
jgi:hypothetical protein